MWSSWINSYSLALFLFVNLFPTVQATEKLTLCVHPYKSASELYVAFTPLAEHLSRSINTKVELLIAKDYDSHIKHIITKKNGIAYLGPASYIKLVKLYGKPPILARLEINGKPTFEGKVFVRNDSAITSLHDLHGKRFAFGDQNSTMSHLVPRYMMLKAGITVDKLAEYAFLGNHTNVALSVLSGHYDAGAVKETVFFKYQSRGLRELATTPALSEHLFIASDNLSPQLIEHLRNTFYDLENSPSGMRAMKSIKRSITAMVPADDSDYDNLRLILTTLRHNGAIN